MPHLDAPYHHHLTLGEGIARAVNRAWTPLVRVLGPPCSWLIRATDRAWLYIMYGLVALTVGVVAWDVALYWGAPRDLNWLWITAYPVGLFVLFRSTGLPDRIFYLRKSLLRQGILDVYDPDRSPRPSLAREPVSDDAGGLRDHFLRAVRERVLPHTAVLTILICAFANYVVHAVGLYRVVPADASAMQALNAYANHALGHLYVLLVSLRLARIVAFSLLMWTHGLVRLSMPNARGETTLYRVRLNPQPGHPDGICGLKNVMDFWTFEASLLVPPLVYTLAWLAISGSRFCATNFWQLCGADAGHLIYSGSPLEVYFWLSFILIALQLLSLWWPVLAVRVHMGHAQNIAKDRLDEIVQKATELRFTVVNSDDAEERKEAAERLAQALEAYQDYQNMPLWPVSRATLKTHVAQLWTVLVFLGVVHQEEKIWPIVKAFLGAG